MTSKFLEQALKKNHLITLFFLFTFSVNSSELAGVTALESSLTIQPDKSNVAEVGQWNFSVGLGYGKRSNPLYSGKDTPLYVLPSVSYYGEHIYFDDGVLGYSIELSPSLYISAITQLNAHSANFSQWHPSNFLVSGVTESISDQRFNEIYGITFPQTADVASDSPISVSQLAERRWALDAGFQINYFTQHNVMMQFSLLTDISGIYKGLNSQIKLEKAWRIPSIQPLSIKVSSSIDWFSEKLANYYYGIGQRDDDYQINYYRAGSGFNTTVGVTANYQLSSQWRAAISYKVTSLAAAIRQSPIVQTSQSNTYFIGATFDF